MMKLAIAGTLLISAAVPPLQGQAAARPAVNAVPGEPLVSSEMDEMSERQIEALKREIEAILKRRMEENVPPGHRITPPLREGIDPEQQRQQLIDELRARYDRMMADMIRDAQPMTQVPLTGPFVPAHETWTMFWDDAIDGEVAHRDKSCEIDLRIHNGAVAGAFVGTVMGDERDAAFSGEVIELSGSKLLTMRQDEPGYSVIYAGHLDAQGRVHGTWYDSRGNSGDFAMWHDGNRPKQGVNGKTEVIRLGAD